MIKGILHKIKRIFVRPKVHISPEECERYLGYLETTDYTKMEGGNIEIPDNYVLPEDMNKLSGKIIALKPSVNEAAKEAFKVGLYRFGVGTPDNSVILHIATSEYSKDSRIHASSGFIKYEKLRELFYIVPEVDLRFEGIMEKINEKINKDENINTGSVAKSNDGSKITGEDNSTTSKESRDL